MANSEHLAWLREGVAAWNLRWGGRRSERLEPFQEPGANLLDADLRGVRLDEVNLYWARLDRADLGGAHLSRADARKAHFDRANLVRAQLDRADLGGAHLDEAELGGANLRGARLSEADLWGADLTEAHLEGADLSGAHLDKAILNGAKLNGANLQRARMVWTDLRGADLTGCRVHGISAWDVLLDGATQENLVVTPIGVPEVSVDRLEIAQFVYVLLDNPKLRDVIDTLTTKVVLILGRFIDERLEVLRAVRDALRQNGYVPMLFDFEGPENQDVLETVQTVARLARFVVADITDAKAVDQELQAIVPQIRVVVRPVMLAEAKEPGKTFQALWRQYPDRLLLVRRYADAEELLATFQEAVIEPAETRTRELRRSAPGSIFEP